MDKQLDQVHQLTDDSMHAFKTLDRDGNGYITDLELKVALSDQTLSAHDRLVYEFLDNNYQALASMNQKHNPRLGISEDDLRELDFATDSSMPLAARAEQYAGGSPYFRVTFDAGWGLGGGLLVSLGGYVIEGTLLGGPVGGMAVTTAALGVLGGEGVQWYAKKAVQSNLTRIAQNSRELNTGNADQWAKCWVLKPKLEIDCK